MAKRIVREGLTVRASAELHHLVVSNHETLDLGNEGTIDIPYVRKVDQSDVVARELEIYLRQYSKRRGVAHIVLKYVQYVAGMNGAVSVRSLSDYRKYLDKHYEVQPTTKGQVFNHSRNFVAHLMGAEHLPPSDLPPKMPVAIGKGVKKSFSEIAGSKKNFFKDDLAGLFEDAKSSFGLDDQEALTLAFCKEAMRLIHEFSIYRIQQWEKDWETVESIISNTDPESSSELANVDSFKASEFPGKRTFELAIKILFSKYGRVIPASLDWPPGVVDFLKRRGWTPRRVCGAFFPTSVQVGDFLTAILSHQSLQPNVDSVAFGLYIDQIKPAFETGFHQIFFDKNRGGCDPKLIASTDPLAKTLNALKAKLHSVLPKIPGGRDYLAQENSPMLVQITPGQGRDLSFRMLDPSSTSHVVKRVIKLASARHKLLEPLVSGGATGENFRTTHTVIKRLSGMPDGELQRGLGHKALSTTARYADRVETRSVIIGKYQDFQKYLVSEAADLTRTGSGYLCSKPSESVCGELEKCFSCDAKRVVLGSPEVAAEWIAWSTKIESNRPRLQLSNPERWSQHWAVKLVEYQSLIDKLDQRTFKEASKLAEGLALPHLD